jgi:hypothetical protein
MAHAREEYLFQVSRSILESAIAKIQGVLDLRSGVLHLKPVDLLHSATKPRGPSAAEAIKTLSVLRGRPPHQDNGVERDPCSVCRPDMDLRRN